MKVFEVHGLASVSVRETSRRHDRDWLLVEQVEMESTDSVFDYFYRDGGNFKTYGRLRLSGASDHAEQKIRDCLEWSDQFVAEQVGIPSLCHAYWESVGDGPSDLDHAYHEFSGLRKMGAGDQDLVVWGSLETLLSRMQTAARRWDVSLSPNVDT